MEAREYERLREHEERYWWHVGRRALFAAVLARGVERDPDRPGLDIGCGTGRNFELLAPYGRFVGTEITTELYRAGATRPPRPVVIADGESLPFPDASLSICTFFDVLEHVGPEDRFLLEVRRVLGPGGVVLLSVPAYMFLWSDHDVSLRHHRRYVRSTLTDSLTRNGFEVLRMTYAMASILPLVAAYRMMSRALPRRGEPRSSYVATPSVLNRLLVRVLGLEARWLSWGDMPFGTSLFALARKPGS
jgi:SAM-dependent methyltransferase